MDYNLLSALPRGKCQGKQVSLSKFNGIKSTNSNTNTKASTHIGQILKDLRSDAIEIGHLTTEKLYELVMDDAYLEYLRYVPNNELLKRCSKYGNGYKDSNGHMGFRPALCGDRARCLIDASIYTNGLANNAFDLLKAIADKWHNSARHEYPDFWDDTFTLPQELQLAITNAGNEGKLAFQHAITSFYRKMYGGLPAVCLNFQTWSSKHPLDITFNHFHNFGLNIFYKPESDSFVNPDNFYTVDSYIDIDKAQKTWLVELQKLAKTLSVELPKEYINGTKKIVFNHHYKTFSPYAYTEIHGIKKSNYALIKHEINYDMRRPIIDIVKYFSGEGRQLDLTGAQVSRLQELISPEKDKKMHTWIGWLADGVKNRYLSAFNLYVKSKSEIISELKTLEREDSYTCPICGETMHRDEDCDYMGLVDCANGTVVLTEQFRTGHVRIDRIQDTEDSDDIPRIVIGALIDAFTSGG